GGGVLLQHTQPPELRPAREQRCYRHLGPDHELGFAAFERLRFVPGLGGVGPAGPVGVQVRVLTAVSVDSQYRGSLRAPLLYWGCSLFVCRAGSTSSGVKVLLPTLWILRRTT